MYSINGMLQTGVRRAHGSLGHQRQRDYGCVRAWIGMCALDQVFSDVIRTTPTIPRFSEIRYLTIPARSGISDVIPTIPTIPQYFEISVPPYDTSSIRCFQQSYPRYPRVPRYGIPRVYTLGMPVMVPYPRFLCIFSHVSIVL